MSRMTTEGPWVGSGATGLRRVLALFGTLGPDQFGCWLSPGPGTRSLQIAPIPHATDDAPEAPPSPAPRPGCGRGNPGSL